MSLFQGSAIPPKTTSFRPVIPNFSLLTSHLRISHPRLSISQSSQPDPKPDPDPKPRTRRRHPKPEPTILPTPIPRKPKRGRKSEAKAVEDFIRQKLETTFETIRQQNPEGTPEIGGIMKERALETRGFEEEEEEEGGKGGKMVVEEECSDWPLDAEVGWGIRASEYFEKHSIRNVVGEDGVEIDWEGEVDDGWVKEINCLEWESFAFHPSPLVVLVFERYNKASDNWRLLKELEKAAKVYWSAKDRLPPRTVKLDINIERDLAYALNVRECPQILFLRGHKIIHREKELRTADELVHMIAHFYYNAKKPQCMKDED